MGGLSSTIAISQSSLKAASETLSVVSSNIASASTTAGKEESIHFSSIVGSNGEGGGVVGTRSQNISQQGSIERTNNSTNLALTTEGMFVVNEKADGTGEFRYTRDGSFDKDSEGNLRNKNGDYLMGWPLDPDGLLPGEIGNTNTTAANLLESLEVVNFQTVTGVASATNKIELGLNLDASQDRAQGAGDTITLDTGATFNQKIASDEIIIPNSVTNTRVGDNLTVTVAGTSTNFEYGGFVTSNDITFGTGILGAVTSAQIFTGASAGDKFTITTVTSGTVTYTYTPTQPNALLGQFNNLDSLEKAINDTPGLAAKVVNNQLYISPEDANEAISFVDVAGGFANHLGLTGRGPDITATPVLGATSTTTPFSSATDGDNFTITTGNNNSITLTYRTAPALAGEFSTLTELMTEVNTVGGPFGISAAINSNVLHITSSSVPPVSLTFKDKAGTFVASLGLVGGLGTDDNRFNSLQNLSTLVNNTPGLSSIIENPTNDASLNIFSSSPLDIVTFGTAPTIGTSNDLATTPAYGASDSATVFAGAATDGDGITVVVSGKTLNFTMLTASPDPLAGEFNSLDSLAAAINAFGTGDITAAIVNESIVISPVGDNVITSITDSGPGGSNFATTLGLVGEASDFLSEFGLSRGPFGPAYDPLATVGDNMASGKVSPHYFQNVRIYDSLGDGKDLRVGFLKIDNNTWAAEIFAVDKSEIVTSRDDGYLTSGIFQFNGDGSLRTAETTLTDPIDIAWSNGASASQITFNFGTAGSPAGTEGALTIGQKDGLRQLYADFSPEFIRQNGNEAGTLSTVTFDGDGHAIAGFTNGDSVNVYRVPIANFPNINGLIQTSGNVYRSNPESGTVNLIKANNNIESNALEQPTADIPAQMTVVIIEQQIFDAAVRAINAANEMTEEASNIGR